MSDALFEFTKAILNGVNIFFIVYLIGYATFLFIAVAIGSSDLYRKRQMIQLESTIHNDYYIPVSIIVPAYNEEVTVVETVKSLLALEYTVYEIVVIDDGSKDRTSEKLINAFGMKEIRRPIQRKISCKPEECVYESFSQKAPLTLVKKKNGGKADSLNMGINVCRYPYFICMDADSVLQQDSLSNIVKPVIEHGDVVAVGGAVRPANGVELENGRVRKFAMPDSTIACMQTLEYDRSFLASRIMFDKFNGSMIISGAFGLFKKDTAIACGGYDHTTMGEDMELVVKLHEYCIKNAIKYSIRYAPDAVCWSQVPENLNDLCKQRRRWHIGLFQSMWRHKDMLGNPNYGPVGIISYLYFLIYELLSPVIEVIGIAVTIAAAFVNLLYPKYMVIFFLTYAVYGMVLTMTAFFARIQTIDLTLTPKDALKAMSLCLFEITILRFIMAFTRMTAFIGYKKKKNNWGRIERKKINYDKEL